MTATLIDAAGNVCLTLDADLGNGRHGGAGGTVNHLDPGERRKR